MATYRTPGVYIEEIAKLPASIAQVPTAVPAFVGFTETYTYDGVSYQNVPTKVKSLLEYEQIFGGEATGTNRSITVTVDDSGAATDVELSTDFLLYHSLRHFYANGGGDAYIVSVDTYTQAASNVDADTVSEINAGITELEKADEVTLVLTPDAYALSSATFLGEVQVAALNHCNKMQDRFAIMDVRHDDTNSVNVPSVDATAFRTAVGTQYLKYGAAYYPELNSTLGPNGEVELSGFSLQDEAESAMTLEDLATASGDTALAAYNTAVVDLAALGTRAAFDQLATDYAAIVTPAAAAADPDFEEEMKARANAIKAIMDTIYGYGATMTNAEMLAYVEDMIDNTGTKLEPAAFTLLDYDSGWSFVSGATGVLGAITAADYSAPVDYALTASVALSPLYAGNDGSQEDAANAGRAAFDTLFTTVHGYLGELFDLAESLASGSDLFTTSKSLAGILAAIRGTGYTLPPSGAVAGIYAAVDDNRGVWKAPANVSLTAVASLPRKMLASELDDLNMPSDGQGKSVNAIRAFRGKGILVYGARTLAGNDNEWRYVPVRRLFNMVEESTKKATEQMIFEPNDANTWQKIRAMIGNFLTGLWRDGALAGAKPEDAFYVKCALNETMTAQDILEGKLIVEIGMAAVRPAEFIILKFSHKLQES